MAFIDYYKILGVDKTIAQKDVKRAYLKRAKQFHPDLHPDDPKANGFGGSGFEGFDFSQFTGGGGFSSFFQDLFGGGMHGQSMHRQYQEKPTNTQATVTIDMYTALLGGDIMVTTGTGERLRLKVKPETQPGTKVRLRGKGRGGTDLILTYQVKLPTGLSDRQKELLQQMRVG